MIARERSLPTDRLFPFGPGSPRRRFDIFAVAGRARRLLGELTRISLRSIRATACYRLRDADLPRQRRTNMSAAGFNTTVSVWRTRYRLRHAA